MGFWLWTTLCFAAVAPPAAEVPSRAAQTTPSLEERVRELAEQVRAGEGAAAHQLGDLALERGHTALAAAWYLHGAELGDADARGHLEWLMPQLSREDWSELDLERARLTRWLEGEKPSGWLAISGRPLG